MSLSHLPDSAEPHVAMDPQIPAEDRRRLQEAQAHLTPSTAAPRSGARALLASGVAPLLGGNGRAARLSRKYHGRYVVATDLDPDAKILLQRAQSAISTVLDSRVNRDGLLDDMDNALMLPAEEWEIAQALVAQSRMWAEQRDLRASALTPLQKARFKPQREALRSAQESVVKRVQALEEYAERALAADAAYGPAVEPAVREDTVQAPPPDDGEVIREFESRDEDYRELLVDNVGHDLATSRVRELGQDATELEAALREVSRARRRLGPPSP
ncbi:hypothetical protein [Actinomadura alba]|uniref:Uncharacterized protein n=1 Tax=Actinomadura alba TaxID=406431 RepID=A0ABR7LM87_9ACTN|nr:hypothetical protein [Actinomadura alba]MBC6465508.1 hypothetical protein [Actinomadura alba]